MKSSLLEQVRNRLAEEAVQADNRESGIDKAIRLSDKYSSVKPEEYILPLTLSIGMIRQ